MSIYVVVIIKFLLLGQASLFIDLCETVFLSELVVCTVPVLSCGSTGLAIVDFLDLLNYLYP